MAQSMVISGLVTKHSELAGQIQHYQKQIDRMQADMNAIGSAIKIIDPEFNLREIKAKTPKPNNRFFKSREATQLILEAFRDLGGDQATDAIQAYIAERKQLDLEAMTVEGRRAFKATIFTIMKRLQKRNLISESDRRGTVIVWRLLSTSTDD